MSSPSQIEPPNSLTPAERNTFARLVDDLAAVGIDPGARQELIGDFVRLGSALDALREAETKATGSARMPLTRAINVSSAERRRLHEALFKGARQPRAGQPAPAHDAAVAVAKLEADTAWRRFFFHAGEQGPTESAPSEAELLLQHGKPSWNALLYDSLESQMAGEAAVERYGRRGGRPEDDYD